MRDGVMVLAEPGSTHGGEYTAMRRLVRAAAEAGCDAVKWQWLSSPERLAARRNAGAYVEAYRALAFPVEWLASLREVARGRGLETWCSVYLPEDVATVAPLIDGLKVASFEAGATDLRRAVRGAGRPWIVSLGLGAATGVVGCDGWPVGIGCQAHESVRDPAWPVASRCARVQLVCTSAYPTPTEAAGLHRLRSPELLPVCSCVGMPGTRVGYSDHTRDVAMGALAVAAGAEVVEVHVRLDETPVSSPDYAVSLTPAELGEYVRRIRHAERALGDGQAGLLDAERPWTKYRAVSESTREEG